MNAGRTVFAQLMDHLPRHTFRRLVRRYQADKGVRRFSAWDQFACLAFAQLTSRESLRDIEACLGALPERLYHMGLSGPVSKSTLADANERQDWRLYADFAQVLIHEARRMYAGDALDLELEQTVYALGSTTIDLCLELFPWSYLQPGQAALKLHTLLDLRGSIPAYVWITPATLHDVRILDVLIPEPGSIYILDRG